MHCTSVYEEYHAFLIFTASATHSLWSTTHRLWCRENETY